MKTMLRIIGGLVVLAWLGGSLAAPTQAGPPIPRTPPAPPRAPVQPPGQVTAAATSTNSGAQRAALNGGIDRRVNLWGR